MARNYIVTMPSDKLYGASFGYDAPFQLQLSDGHIFCAEKVVRVIPKRRMVVFGIWQGQPVVAKLFFDKRRARRHMEKDMAGIKALQGNNVPTPALHYSGVTEDRRTYVLLLERIFDARNLEEIIRDKTSIKKSLYQLQAVIIEIAIQHVFGVLQHDLHFKNFLLTDKVVYTLDGAQVELFPKMLTKKQSMHNIALFLSQLGSGVEEYQEALFRYYAKARGWPMRETDRYQLFLLIKKGDENRWRRYEKKIFRESTDFAPIRYWNTVGMYDRRYVSPDFLSVIHHPESAFTHLTTCILKEGRSSTVVKVSLDGREFVVKRHNVKSIWHYVRRCLRPTRAASSWRLAQKLKLFRTETAAPAAFIEKRFLGLRGRSYFVTEYVPGESVGDFFIRYPLSDKKVLGMVKSVALLLKSLFRLRITHGDLKSTNMLINVNNKPVLIDLDGAVEHASQVGLCQAWRKEINRFLENFHSQPLVQEKFKKELGKK